MKILVFQALWSEPCGKSELELVAKEEEDEKVTKALGLSSCGFNYTGSGPHCRGRRGEKVNINTAVKEELIELDRIGPKYAERIIEYREKVAPFEKPEDIMKVKGIGKKTYEANKDRIVVE